MSDNATVVGRKQAAAQKPGKPAPKTPEQRSQEKRQRFINLAPARVQKALDRIRQVKACASRTGYTYSEEEAAKVVAALKNAVQEVANAFSGQRDEKTAFTL